MSKDKKRKKKTSEKTEKKDTKKEERIKAEIIKEFAEAEEITEKKDSKEKPSKSQLLTESRMLRDILIVLVLLIGVFAAIIIFSKASNSFVLNGVKYTLVHEGKLNLYNTKISFGKVSNYNFYLRNNPKKLEKDVPFNGSLYIRPFIAMNYSNDVKCGGDGTIAIANLINLYTFLGTKVVRDPNATCDPQKRYVYVNIQSSDRTSIQEIAPACYNININNCEILPATERYMTETFSVLKKYLSSSA